MAPPVVAVLVAHATATHLAEALESLAAQTYRDLEVIVVTVDYPAVPETGRPVMVLPGPPHASFPEAVSYGLDNAGGIRAAYVLLCHDDVVLAPDAVARMVARASEDGVAAVGAKLVEWDDATVLQEVGAGLDRFALRRSALDAGEVDAGQRDEVTDVLFCSDACLLVRADAFAAVGGLDPGTWPLYEDIDLCWRLRASGRRVVVATDARVRHAATMSRGRRQLDAPELAEATERGRLRFILKHFSRFGVAVLLPQLIVVALARVVSAAVAREFWRIRATVRAWSSVAPQAFGLRHAHRTNRPAIDDRELLSIGAREAILERRHERSEWLSRTVAAGEAMVRRARVLVREPVAWGCIAAAIVVLLIVRSILFGGTFTLGELRSLPTFGAAMRDLFAHVRREGLDPFAPAGPGLVALGTLRTIALGGAFAEKLALFLPFVVAGVAGARIGRVLDLGRRGRGWLGVGAAANPITFLFLRDGELGSLVAWTGALWLLGSFLDPDASGVDWAAFTDRLRFYARWAIGWSLVVALDPSALLVLIAIGAAVVAARRDDGRTEVRLRALAAGAGGSLVLLLPWSLEWFTTRSPLVGRPGWLVTAGWSGIAAATLGAGYALVGWLVVAYGGALLVGMTRTILALAAVGAAALLAGIGGVMPSQTMLVAAGACALSMIALAARSIFDELPRYELGIRHGLVIAGVGVLVTMWFVSAVFFVATGVRARGLPIIASGVQRSGRVLWLSSTTGGVRSWATDGFASNLRAFPPPGDPASRLASGAIAAARESRTHRAGSILALADVSHVVVLDAGAARGLDGQADLTRSEVHDQVVVYRNDSWFGPVGQLSAPPHDPFSARGLAAASRSSASVPVTGWPGSALSIGPAASDAGVVYIAGGARGGWHIRGARARIVAAGEYVPASSITGLTRARPPSGRHALVPLEVILVVGALVAWGAAAYLARPGAPASSARRTEPRLMIAPPAVAAPSVAVLAALVIGWSGVGARASSAFLSSAWYCPPVGAGFTEGVAVANGSRHRVEVVVRPALHAPPTAHEFVGPRSRATFSVRAEDGAVVESFGERIAVAMEVSRQRHADSALCASDARGLNLFPEGGRAATLAVPRLFERYVIYNPFADVARASVRFLSPKEMIAPPPLQDVQVRPGSFVIVNPEQQFEPMLDLSTVIRVWQGRAIVARRLTTVEQVSWSLSSPLVTSGLLPRGVTQNGQTKVIALNPTDSPVRVSVDGFADDSTIPMQNIDVEPNSRTSFVVNSFAPQAHALLVNVHADHAVALESLVVPKGRKGLSLLPPLTPAKRWVVPLAENRQLIIENPGGGAARVSLDRLGSAPDHTTLSVPAHHVLVTPFFAGDQIGVLLRASRPVTVVSVGQSGAVAGASF